MSEMSLLVCKSRVKGMTCFFYQALRQQWDLILQTPQAWFALIAL